MKAADEQKVTQQSGLVWAEPKSRSQPGSESHRALLSRKGEIPLEEDEKMGRMEDADFQNSFDNRAGDGRSQRPAQLGPGGCDVITKHLVSKAEIAEKNREN